MTFANWDWIIFVSLLLIALSPFAAFFLPRKYALHLILDGCMLGFIYFAAKGISLPACISGVPIVFIGNNLLNDYAQQRKKDRPLID